VGSQDVLHGFLSTPARAVSERAFKTVLVSVTDALHVLLGNAVAHNGSLAEESVLEITSGMTLGLEKSIEVPERALNPTVGRHLVEAHREKNFSELRSNLKKRVKMAALRWLSSSINVSLFELSGLP